VGSSVLIIHEDIDYFSSRSDTFS